MTRNQVSKFEKIKINELHQLQLDYKKYSELCLQYSDSPDFENWDKERLTNYLFENSPKYFYPNTELYRKSFALNHSHLELLVYSQEIFLKTKVLAISQ